MSVLDRGAIKSRLASGELYVGPILDWEHQVGPASIDLRLGTVAFTARARGVSEVDPEAYRKQEGDHASTRARQQKLERHDVVFHTPLLIHPGQLTLVPTLEWVDLPNDLMGYVTARSSWAREGLSIATATLINPCYSGIITLELANLGQIPVRLYPGMRIAQIAFHKIEVEYKKGALESSQFKMSFEPEPGDVSQFDDKFIPRSTTKR